MKGVNIDVFNHRTDNQPYISLNFLMKHSIYSNAFLINNSTWKTVISMNNFLNDYEKVTTRFYHHSTVVFHWKVDRRFCNKRLMEVIDRLSQMKES